MAITPRRNTTRNSQGALISRYPDSQRYQYSSEPAQVHCNHCNNDVETEVESETGALTIILVIGLCMIGCVCCCCLLPYLLDNTKDKKHKCQKCKGTCGYCRRVG